MVDSKVRRWVDMTEMKSVVRKAALKADLKAD